MGEGGGWRRRQGTRLSAAAGDPPTVTETSSPCGCWGDRAAFTPSDAGGLDSGRLLACLLSRSLPACLAQTYFPVSSKFRGVATRLEVAAIF